MRAVLVGAVESTRVALRTLADSPDWEVAAVVTLPARLSARHSDFVDVGAEANAAGIDTIHAVDGNSPEVVDRIRDLAPDFVFVIGWSQICGPALLATATDRVIGYHPAPLPRLRGRGVIPWTILLGEPITAGTLFWIDGGVDSGAILAQRFFHVAANETATSLYAKHMEALHRMLAESLVELAAGRTPSQTQDERYATWAAKRIPADGEIDWRSPTEEVWRLVRAVGHPYPGAFTSSNGHRLLIWEADPWSASTQYAACPGQIIARDNGSFVVRCGDGGALRVTRWEAPEGQPPKLHARLGRH